MSQHITTDARSEGGRSTFDYHLRPTRPQIALILMLLGLIITLALVNLRTGREVETHTAALNRQLQLVSGNVASLQREVLNHAIKVHEFVDSEADIEEVELSRALVERQLRVIESEPIDDELFQLRFVAVVDSIAALDVLVAEAPSPERSEHQERVNDQIDQTVGNVMRLFDLTESENFVLVHQLENTLDMWRQVQWFSSVVMSLLVVMLIISVRRMLVANYRSAKASLDDQNHRYEQMREASLRLESRYREVVDDVGEVVWRCDGRGRFSLLNQAWVHLTGDVHRHALGRSVLASFHPDDHDRIEQAMMTAMATSSNQVVERARLLRVDGGELTVVVSARGSEDENGRSYVAGTISDVSDRVRAEAINKIQNEALAMIVRGIPVDQVLGHLEFSIANFAKDTQFRFVRSRRDLSDLADGSVDLSPELQDDLFLALEWRFADHAAPVADLDSLTEMAGRLAVMAVERHANAVKLYHDATHDELTGLPNRVAFIDRLEAALSRATQTAEPAAVLVVDLDRFKVVNESLGHSAGDRLICAVARRLAARLRASDMIARLGGDEFVILLEDTDIERAELVADRILEALGHPIQLGVATARVSASVGMAVPQPGSTFEDLLKWADIAMYRAKRAGGGRWVMFDEKLRSWAEQRHDTEVALQGAAGRGELELWFQPVVSLDEPGAPKSFEALLRWRRPGVGLVPPSDFVSVAEESDLVFELGDWVIAEGARRLARWQKLDERVRVSVNVSGRELVEPGFADRVRAAIDNAGAVASGLTLEVTEGVLIEDASVVSDQLQALQRFGVKIAIDDFGTGYSSLRYLRHLPVDVLKIDRAFVSSGGGDELTDPTIVSSVTKLGHELGLYVVAEGVETSTQLEALMGFGVDLGQGFLFSQPVQVEVAEQMLLNGLDSAKADLRP